MKNQKGLTLMNLLVIISIVGILGAFVGTNLFLFRTNSAKPTQPTTVELPKSTIQDTSWGASWGLAKSPHTGRCYETFLGLAVNGISQIPCEEYEKLKKPN